MTSLIEDLEWRGLIKQATNLEITQKYFLKGKCGIYVGFDPTGDSLHVGSLIQIINAIRLAKDGQNPVCLIGGGTGLIGDPSGKSKERNLSSEQEVSLNSFGINGQLQDIFDNNSLNIKILNNENWIKNLVLIDFFRDIGKHFSVNSMIQRDSVKKRLEEREQGISFTEFSYALLQAYDFKYLNENCDVVGQFGGSDQYGNIVAGIDLIKKTSTNNSDVFGLTFPLLTTKSGNKFGKTEDGTIWLDKNKTSVYKFYQFWMRTEDQDIETYLKYFSLKSQSEIEELLSQNNNNPELKLAQKSLAYEMTQVVHGEKEAKNVCSASETLFAFKNELSESNMKILFGEIPSKEASISQNEISAKDILVGDGFLFKSNGELKRAILAGSVFVGTDKILNQNQAIDIKNFILTRNGKKNFILIKKAESK